VSKFSQVNEKVKQMFESGMSKFEIIDSFDFSFKEFKGLSPKYFKSIVLKIFRENFKVYESLYDNKINYEFIYNQRNDDHLPIILGMFEELMYSSDIDFTGYYEYPSGEKETTIVVRPFGNKLVDSFQQVKKVNEDNTVKLKREVRTNNDFQRVKIFNHMSNFLKQEKINVIKVV